MNSREYPQIQSKEKIKECVTILHIETRNYMIGIKLLSCDFNVSTCFRR